MGRGNWDIGEMGLNCMLQLGIREGQRGICFAGHGGNSHIFIYF